MGLCEDSMRADAGEDLAQCWACGVLTVGVTVHSLGQIPLFLLHPYFTLLISLTFLDFSLVSALGICPMDFRQSDFSGFVPG